MTDAEEREGYFSPFSFDNVVNIFGYLPPRDLTRASEVCKLWHEASNVGSLWKTHCLQRWSFCNLNKISPGERTWQRYYITRHKIDTGAVTGRPGLDYTCKSLRGHKGKVTDVIFVTTNGIYDEGIIEKNVHPVIASSSQDKSVCLWNPHDGKLMFKNTDAHESSVSCLALISPNAVFASGDQGGNVNIWDVTTSSSTRLQETHSSEVTSMHCGTNVLGKGKQELTQPLLYVASRSGEIKLWDIRDTLNSQHTLECSINNLDTILLKGSHTLIASGKGSVFQSNPDIKVYDIRNLAPESFRGPEIFTLHDQAGSTVTCSSWVPSQQNILAVGYSNGSITLWDITNGKKVHSFSGHVGNVTAITAVGSKLISIGKDLRVCLWDLGDKKLLGSYSDHKGEITGLYADAFKVMTCSRDYSIRAYSWLDRKDSNGRNVQMLGSCYTLLGGSLQRAGGGFEKVVCDYTTCIGMANDVMKAYSFQV